jgi:hypothetical protein
MVIVVDCVVPVIGLAAIITEEPTIYTQFVGLINMFLANEVKTLPAQSL